MIECQRCIVHILESTAEN